MRPELPFALILLLVQVGWPGTVLAGGTCLLHPQAFRLRSDTIRWEIKLRPGAECIQGLRWSTILIDKITIVEPPKTGRVIVEGPAFRYFSDPAQPVADRFKRAISGTSLHIPGNSSIEIEVSP